MSSLAEKSTHENGHVRSRPAQAPAVAAFAAASPQEVLYHQFLQWLATVSFTRESSRYSRYVPGA